MKSVAEALHRLVRAPATHRAAELVGLAGREPAHLDRHLEHLVLVQDDAERVAQQIVQQRMVGVRHGSCGSSRSSSRRRTYGLTAPPTIGPGRTIATCTARSSRLRGWVRVSIWIWARLSIWNRPTVSPLQIAS